MARGATRWCGLVLSLAATTAAVGAEPVQPEARLELERAQATVGDRVPVTITVTVPADCELKRDETTEAWGTLRVDGPAWSRTAADERRTVWTWTATVAAFRTGPQELPSREFVCERGEEALRFRSEPATLDVLSVLAEAGPSPEPPEIADIKGPVSLPPQFLALTVALGVLVGLALLSGLLAWLHRRYARRLQAVPAPEDPFRRVPPHEWVYREIQHLLEQRLAERGEVDRFYAELARILKLYLGGRYRADLMERTTEEVLPVLRGAGVPREAVDGTRRLLTEADAAKFARELPGPDRWRSAVETVYGIVDATRPAETAEPGAA